MVGLAVGIFYGPPVAGIAAAVVLWRKVETHEDSDRAFGIRFGLAAVILTFVAPLIGILLADGNIRNLSPYLLLLLPMLAVFAIPVAIIAILRYARGKLMWRSLALAACGALWTLLSAVMFLAGGGGPG